jgi:transcription antitermination factor NusG
VHFGEEPAIVPHSDIQKLRGREVDGVIVLKIPDRFIVRPGDRVRIVDGWLTTTEGVVDEIAEQDEKNIDFSMPLSILVQMFGGTTRVRAKLAQVEKIGT